MSFFTFCVYFIGVVVMLVVGWVMFVLIRALIAIAVLRGSDALGEARSKRALAKWDRIEAALDDDEATP